MTDKQLALLLEQLQLQLEVARSTMNDTRIICDPSLNETIFEPLDKIIAKLENNIAELRSTNASIIYKSG